MLLWVLPRSWQVEKDKLLSLISYYYSTNTKYYIYTYILLLLLLLLLLNELWLCAITCTYHSACNFKVLLQFVNLMIKQLIVLFVLS